MTPGLSAADLAAIAAFGVGGLLVGIGYFAALRRAVSQFVGGSPWHGPVALTVGRFAAVALLLALAARFGTTALLAAFLGLLLARGLAVRAARRTA